jgi:hypothetical protein
VPRPTQADAELLLHLYEVRREPELRTARKWFLTEFKPESFAEIKARYLSHSDEDRWFRMTVSYWDMVGAIVNQGALHAELFFDHTGEDIATWDRCKSWVAEARAAIRPTYMMQFERLVEAHKAHRAKAIAALQAPAPRAAGAPAKPPRARAARAGRSR